MQIMNKNTVYSVDAYPKKTRLGRKISNKLSRIIDIRMMTKIEKYSLSWKTD